MRKFNVDDYEPVEERIRRFYADHEDGCILTELVSDANARECAVFKSSVGWGGVVRATGWAQETREMELAHTKDGREYESVNFTSWVENAETSAIGRALANAGYQGNKKPRASREEMEKVNRVLEGAGLVENKMLKCPKCGMGAVIKGAPQYGGGYVCWKKKGGCGAKYGDNVPEILSQLEETPMDKLDKLANEAWDKSDGDPAELFAELSTLLTTPGLDIAKIAAMRAAMPEHRLDAGWLKKAIARVSAEVVKQEEILTANVKGDSIRGSDGEVPRG